jgi:hypothetical protein
MEVVQGMEPQINMHELDANVNLPRANETVDWVLTKIILMNEDKYLVKMKTIIKNIKLIK